MSNPIRQLDRLLRGEATQIEELRGTGGEVRVPVGGLSVVITGLGMIYGACMGLFSLTKNGSHQSMQVLASAVKLPALFLLTLLITFPSLYVFNALVGSRMRFVPTLRLLVGSMAVMLAVLASIGPIVAFFSISTTSYSFMIILNVAVCALSGVLGLSFMLQTLQRVWMASELNAAEARQRAKSQATEAATIPVETVSSLTIPEPLVLPPSGSAASMNRTPARPNNVLAAAPVRTVFVVWLAVFGLVGAQMGWVLRPFIGAPGTPFTWLRSPDSNFFEAVLAHLRHLVS